jgi:hypothetical protein
VSITKATKTHRGLRSKAALISAISLSLAAGSAALAVPAQATATVAPAASVQPSSLFVLGHIKAEKPRVVGIVHGTKLVAYEGKVVYPSHGLVQVKQERWERDQWPDKDDYLGTSYFSKRFNNHGGTLNFREVKPLKRTDFRPGDKTEEVYQRVAYRVFKNGHWSAWSKWVYSDTAHIHR